jgi:ketosteroid isomerase-like protein
LEPAAAGSLAGAAKPLDIEGYLPPVDAPSDEQIRAGYAAFNERGEFNPALYHPDVEWHNDPDWPGGGVHRGAGAIRRDLDRQREAWGEAHYEPVEIIRLDDRILVLVDVSVTGKASGAPVSVEGAHIFTVRDGKVVKVQAFTDRGRARAAAGLR